MSDVATMSSTPPLRDVTGPSAFGDVGWRRLWDLLWLTSKTDFRMRYVDSVLGYFWALMRPLLSFGIIFLFLRGILGFGDRIPNFGPMLMMNIMLFQYFQETTVRGMRCVSSSEALVRKMQFPRILIPLSTSMTASITLLLNLCVGVLLLLAFGLTPTWGWLFLLVAAFALIIFSTSIALILSVAYVRVPDIGQVWMIISRVAFYVSPILYPIEILKEPFRQIVMLNPLTPIFVEVRHFVIDPSAPQYVELAGGWGKALIPFAIAATCCVFSVWYFKREAPGVAEAI